MKTLATLAGAACFGLLAASSVPAFAASLDLDVVESGVINGATFTRADEQPFGSDHKVFLRYEDVGGDHGQVDDPNVKDQEEGYNSDYRPVQFEELTDAVHTHAVALSSVEIIDGHIRFILDNNEPNSTAQETISLEMLQIYIAGEGGDLANGKVGDTFLDGNGDPLSVLKIYDMDEGPDGDSIVLMTDINSGSGQADLVVDIPFAGNPNFQWLILYAKQGFSQPTEAGFEEWGVRTGENPPVIPLPAAAWSALSMLGTLGVIKKIRRARRQQA